MEDLLNFKTKQILLTNETQKILYLLGTVEGKEGEAITILTPKIHDPEALEFKNVETSFINDIYFRFNAQVMSSVEVQMIFPINEKHKKKYCSRKQLAIHFESGEEYVSKSQEILKRQLAHIQWVHNIVEGKSQVERILFRNDDFLIVPDFKYTDFKETKKLHLMALFVHPKLHTLRDLTGEHVQILQGVRKSIDGILQDKFGLDLTNVRMYFHYPPTFYRLHIHIMHLSLESLSCRVERCHDFNLVIQNIKMKSNYYQQVTLNTFVEKQ